ncbi:hypothetical protein DV735_g3022, partial [Chaetothyriales sp. CBS 134920]
MSFGFSPSDIKELLRLINWVRGSLREDGGSREDFQSLDQVQTTLQQALDNASSSAHILSVSDADRDSLLKAVDRIKTTAGTLSARQAKFGKKFGNKKSASWHREVFAKLEWMLDKDGHRSRQKDVVEQTNMLSNQLNISGLKTIVQRVDEAASMNEKLHNTFRDGAHSNKLELRDLIQTTGQKQKEVTLTTSASLLDRLNLLAADNQQFRGKLESEMSSLRSNAVAGRSGITQTYSQLEYFHDTLNQQIEAVVDNYDADAVDLTDQSTLATACTTPDPDRDFDSDDEACNDEGNNHTTAAAGVVARHDPRYPPGGWSCSTPLCWGRGIAYGKRCGYCGFEAGVVEAAGR